MTTPLEDAQQRMFNRFEAFLGDMNEVIELEGHDTPVDQACWLRADGTSIGFQQVAMNEVVFRLQVPMDSLLALADKVASGEVDLEALLAERRTEDEAL